MAALATEVERDNPKPTSGATMSEVRAERTAARNKRRLAEAEWRPAFSVAYREVKLALRSNQAQRAFHLGLVHAQRSLYFLYHTLNTHGGEKAVDAAEKIIHKRLEDIHTRFDTELKRLKAAVEVIAPDGVDGYTDPKEFVVQMFTPEASRFGNLLSMYDDIVSLADTLRFAGRNRKEIAEVVQGHRNALVRFSRELHILHMQARNMARRADREEEARRSARIENARNDGDSESVTAPSESEVDAAAAEVVSAEEATPPKAKRSMKKDEAAAAEA